MDPETTRRRVGPWELNRVHNADCAAALREMPDSCLDVIVTSPPYWGQRESQNIGGEQDPRDYVTALVGILAECIRCLKPSGTLWLNVGDAYNTPINWRESDHRYSTLGADASGLDPTNSAYTKKRGCRRAFIDPKAPWLQYGNLLALPYRIVLELCNRGALYRGEVIWEKSRPMPEGICRRPHRRHESIYVFAKSERHDFRVKPPVGSVWRLRQTPNNVEHCSTFPLDLPVQCISAAGVQGRGVIFDPFMGSGTTALAAQQLDHDWLGFELDPAHSTLANKRVTAVGSESLFAAVSAPQQQ